MSGSVSDARVYRGGPKQIDIFGRLRLWNVSERPAGGFGKCLAEFANAGDIGQVGPHQIVRFSRAKLEVGGVWSSHRARSAQGSKVDWNNPLRKMRAETERR